MRAAVARALAALSCHAPRKGKWLVRRIVEHWIRAGKLAVNRTFRVRRLGLRWELNPADYMQRDLFWHGDYESKEGQDWLLLRPLIKPDDVLLDVGANYGYFSLLFAHELRGQCAVHAFEPNPPVFNQLATNIALNNGRSITLHQMGLGNATRSLRLQCDVANSGASFVNETGPTDKASGAITIKLTTLDQFVATQQVQRLDVIKVDIEGYELHFVEGGRETLKRFKPNLLMEICAAHLARNRCTVGILLEALKSVGYRSFYWQDGNAIREFDELTIADPQATPNIFCFHEVPHGFPLPKR